VNTFGKPATIPSATAFFVTLVVTLSHGLADQALPHSVGETLCAYSGIRVAGWRQAMAAKETCKNCAAGFFFMTFLDA